MDPREPNNSENGGGAKDRPAQEAAAASVGIAEGARAHHHRHAEHDFAPVYPVLVEQMAPAGPGGVMTAGRGAGGGSDVGQQVQNVLRDVLGWQPRAHDAKGFLGALTSSFELSEYEGHTEATWKERRFAVQSDLSGGISGAQASLLTRARRAVEEAQPILAALYPLISDADREEVEAYRAIVSQQLDELIGELSILGGPRVARVDQLFATLLDDAPLDNGAVSAVADPDDVGGALGALRGLMGLSTANEDPKHAFESRVNNIDEEQNVTNFRILADYVIGLRQSWDDNRSHFSRSRLQGYGPRFLGTQLVHLSRHLAVVAESVGELRTILDSVFIGARERQTLEIVPRVSRLGAHHAHAEPDTPEALDARIAQLVDAAPQASGPADDEPFYLEELLSWVESFATREGPRLIELGGKIGIRGAFLQTALRLRRLVIGARMPWNRRAIAAGYFTARVRRGLHELDGHLHALLCEAENAAVVPTADSKPRRAPAAGADR